MKSYSKTRLVTIVGLVVLGTLTEQATANGFRNPPPGAKAQALDGGKIAFIDDPSAVTHNPANLTEIEEAEAFGSATFIYGYTDFTGSTVPGSAETREKWTTIPAIYGAWPAQDGAWTFGLGLSSPWGQSTEWARDSVFQYSAPYFAELLTVDVNPSVATRINDNLAVGAGLQFMYSELDLRQDLAPGATLRADGDGWGLGANVGATVKLHEKHRLAITYRLPMDVDYEGDTKVSGIPGVGNSSFDSEIKFPQIVALGYGAQATETLRVGVDVEWVEFSRFDSLPLDLGANNAAGLAPPSIPEDWDDTWTAGFSLDWQQSERVALRGGYKYLETPIPDATFAPTLPDADRHLLTFGVGYEREAHTLDFAYVWSIIDDRDISGSAIPPYDGTYELTSHIFVLSYDYSF